MQINALSNYYFNEFALKAILANATQIHMEGQSVQNTQTEQCAQAEPKTPPDIAAFMEKLGISPTNSKESDHQAIISKLAELQAAAQTEDEKTNVQNLYAEFNGILQPKGQPPVQPPPETETAGMDQLAEMNKHFLVKKTEA